MKFIAILILLLFSSLNAYAKGGAVSVKGYTKKDGTYVAPHMRSAPDGDKSNNWSTEGNVNPYTGEAGTKDPNLIQPNAVLPSTNQNNPNLSSYPQELNKIPKNAKLNYLGTGWECEHGYHRVSSECVIIEIPVNAHLNYLGNGWECSSGFRRVGLECTAVIVPVNAHLNYLGNDWECSYGFRRSGNECLVVTPPKNGKFNYLGNGWECNYGYHQLSNECVIVVVPQNASLNYLGNGWQCSTGFRQLGNSCVQINNNIKYD